MKLRYDAEANAAYLHVNPDGTRPSESVRRESHGPFVFDYDADGKLLGIEVLDARTVLREATLTAKDFRTVPPTDEEVDAHDGNGGDFLVSFDHRSGGPCCRVMGGEPPTPFTYELVLDASGQKISKSKGHGLTIDEWLRYAPPESLGQFMYNQPTRAKRLYFDQIPRAVDEYLQNADRGLATAMPEVAANPAWHIHAGHSPPSAHSPLSFQTLLNLAAVSAAETPEDLWAFVRNYAPDTAADTHPFLNVLVARAVAYCEDFVRPHLKPRVATAEERAGLENLITRLQNNAAAIDAMPPGAERAKAIQDIIYDAGRRDPFTVPNKDGSLGVGRGWFNALYQVLLGADEGPRFGSVIAAYGIARSISVIQAALAR